MAYETAAAYLIPTAASFINSMFDGGNGPSERQKLMFDMGFRGAFDPTGVQQSSGRTFRDIMNDPNNMIGQNFSSGLGLNTDFNNFARNSLEGMGNPFAFEPNTSFNPFGFQGGGGGQVPGGFNPIPRGQLEHGLNNQGSWTFHGAPQNPNGQVNLPMDGNSGVVQANLTPIGGAFKPGQNGEISQQLGGGQPDKVRHPKMSDFINPLTGGFQAQSTAGLSGRYDAEGGQGAAWGGQGPQLGLPFFQDQNFDGIQDQIGLGVPFSDAFTISPNGLPPLPEGGQAAGATAPNGQPIRAPGPPGGGGTPTLGGSGTSQGTQVQPGTDIAQIQQQNNAQLGLGFHEDEAGVSEGGPGGPNLGDLNSAGFMSALQNLQNLPSASDLFGLQSGDVMGAINENHASRGAFGGSANQTGLVRGLGNLNLQSQMTAQGLQNQALGNLLNVSGQGFDQAQSTAAFNNFLKNQNFQNAQAPLATILQGMGMGAPRAPGA